MPATHDQETCTRNLCKSSCTRNLHVCRSVLYKFFSGCTSMLHTIELSSIPAQKLAGAWHKPCNVIGRRVVLVQETVMNLRQIFRASFWYQFRFLSVCRWHNYRSATSQDWRRTVQTVYNRERERHQCRTVNQPINDSCFSRGLSNKQLLQGPQSKCSGETVGMIFPGTSNEISAFLVAA